MNNSLYGDRFRIGEHNNRASSQSNYNTSNSVAGSGILFAVNFSSFSEIFKPCSSFSIYPSLSFYHKSNATFLDTHNIRRSWSPPHANLPLAGVARVPGPQTTPISTAALQDRNNHFRNRVNVSQQRRRGRQRRSRFGIRNHKLFWRRK